LDKHTDYSLKDKLLVTGTRVLDVNTAIDWLFVGHFMNTLRQNIVESTHTGSYIMSALVLCTNYFYYAFGVAYN